MAAEVAQTLAIATDISTVQCRMPLLRAKLSPASTVLVSICIMHTVRTSGVFLSCTRCRKQHLQELVEVGMCRDSIQRPVNAPARPSTMGRESRKKDEKNSATGGSETKERSAWKREIPCRTGAAKKK